jgi:hypothetical protein
VLILPIIRRIWGFFLANLAYTTCSVILEE